MGTQINNVTFKLYVIPIQIRYLKLGGYFPLYKTPYSHLCSNNVLAFCYTHTDDVLLLTETRLIFPVVTDLVVTKRIIK
jgi:hypothetical protein